MVQKALALAAIDQLLVAFFRHLAPTGVAVFPWGAWHWLAALVLLVWVLARYPKSLGTSLVLAGFLSNLSSQILYGRVVDYLNLNFWYTNSADGLIVGGLLVLALENLRGTRP